MKENNNLKEFNIFKAPYLRSCDSTRNNTSYIMKSFLIAFVPLFLFYWIKYSFIPLISNEISFSSYLYPFVFVLFSALFSFLFEALYFSLVLKEEDCFKKSYQSFSLIPGIILSFVLPINTPIWVLMIACFFSSIVSKMIFGGFGYNLFNPAMLAYLFVMTAFYKEISNGNLIVDGISNVTPLNNIKDLLFNNFNDNLLTKDYLIESFLGNNSHSIAESSPIFCLLILAYLSFRSLINYKLSIIYLLSCFLFTFLLPYSLNYDNSINFSLYSILNGGIMFASVFIVTEPVTSPRNAYAKYIYVIFIALFTVLLRFFSDYNEGVASAVLFMNLFSQTIDKITSKIIVSDSFKKKVIFIFFIILIIFIIVLYMLLRLKELI